MVTHIIASTWLCLGALAPATATESTVADPSQRTVPPPTVPSPDAEPSGEASVSDAETVAHAGDGPAQPEATSAAAPPPTTTARAPQAIAAPAAAPRRDDLGDPVATSTAADPASPRPEDGSRRGIVRPVPRWKWLGLGISAGITTAAAITTTGMIVHVARTLDGKTALARRIRSNAAAPAEVQLDPSLPIGTICELVRPEMDGRGSLVTSHPAVAEECRKGERRATTANVAFGVAVVGLISTGVFTGLLFAKGKSQRETARRQRQLRIGGRAAPGQWGVSLGGRI